MTDSAILDRVRKLLRLAGNNPSQEEATSAAAKAQLLIDQYNLTRAMIELETPNGPTLDDEPIHDLGNVPLDATVGRDRARINLASILARANSCRIYLSGIGRHTCLIGRPSDADTVRYLYAWIVQEMDKLSNRHCKGLGRVYRANFRLGIVDAINGKLREQRRAATETARADAATRSDMALVLVNQALARVEQRGAAVDVWTKQHMKMGRGRASSGRTDWGARAAGRQAGESINLNRGTRPLTSGAARLHA